MIAGRFEVTVLQLYTIDDGELARAVALATARKCRPNFPARATSEFSADFRPCCDIFDAPAAKYDNATTLGTLLAKFSHAIAKDCARPRFACGDDC
jgi:hypothetical protein